MKLPFNPADRVWMILASATGLSYWVSEHLTGRALGAGAVALLFALAALKGWLVIDHFMGLRAAPRLWRRLLLGWLFVVCASLALVYAFSHAPA